ncbi:hypothetical protein PENSPDRAFT_750617 [Peniophora sp. CONT]|nr:hypothetical protein PENSPDRAFT_750617 [Peniophora sp. CONT]
MFRCACNQNFDDKIGLNNHKRHCRKGKDPLSAALGKRRAAPPAQPSGPSHLEPPPVEFDQPFEEPQPLPRTPTAQPLEPTETPRRPSGLPARVHRLPAKLRDEYPPEPPRARRQPQPQPQPLDRFYDDDEDFIAPLLEPDPDPITSHLAPEPSDSPSRSTKWSTAPDEFGVWREYAVKPSLIPDISGPVPTPASYCDYPTPPEHNTPHSSCPWWARFSSSAMGASHAPFLSRSVYYLMDWFYSGSNVKSLGQLNDLVHKVLLREDFSTNDLVGFNAQTEAARLDDHKKVINEQGEKHVVTEPDGWHTESVKVRVACDGVQFASEREAPVFSVKDFMYREPIEVMKAACKEPAAVNLHLFPFRQFFRRHPELPPERIYSEGYNTNRMIGEYEQLIDKPPPSPPDKPGEDWTAYEIVVMAWMFWSDSTHLASFGTASLWPIYKCYANLPLNIRMKMSSFATHHIAYVPKLTETFSAWFLTTFAISVTAAIILQARRDLFQNVWLILLSPAFVHAYVYGILIEFPDRITRRVFPRILFYSVDYPERVLIACLKYLSAYPCAQCLISKGLAHLMGTKNDMKNRSRLRRTDDHRRRGKVEMIRAWIFEKGRSLTSVFIDRVLGPFALTAARSAFSYRLSKFGFDYFKMFVPDMLHDFELGVWKAIFLQILRIYNQIDGAIDKLNERYWLVPGFGRDTIRPFHWNVSDLKHQAGRDYEDLLQCSMPCMEGLIPVRSIDKIHQDMQFTLLEWHAFGKLRMHWDSTRDWFRTSTTRLGAYVRRFKRETEKVYMTTDLPKEVQARSRRKATKAKTTSATTVSATTAKERTLSINTSKYHNLGHFHEVIPEIGSLVGASTQQSEAEHRRGKNEFERVSKSDVVRGISKLERRTKKIHVMNEWEKLAKSDSPSLRFQDSEPLPFTEPHDHHHIARSQNFPVDIDNWLYKNRTDPAFKGYLRLLRDHLLSRLTDEPDDGRFTPDNRLNVKITKNRMYRHKVLRVNYTTYDMRIDQDSINPTSHPFAMMLSPAPEGGHPYMYAQIVAIFHVHARLEGEQSTPESRKEQLFNVLWVRWMALDPEHTGGFRAKRLYRVGFVPIGDPDTEPFGFINPADVLRASHMVPAFAHGRTAALMSPSIVRPQEDEWRWHYVNFFVDRDMVMRYRGSAPGHKSTRAATDYFLDDLDELDEQERSEREAAAADEQSDEDVEMSQEDDVEMDEGDEDDGEDDGEEDSDNESFYESGEEQDFVVPDESAEEQQYASKLFDDDDDDFTTIGNKTGHAEAEPQAHESPEAARAREEEEEDYDIDGEESGEEVVVDDDEELNDPEDGEGPDAGEVEL